MLKIQVPNIDETLEEWSLNHLTVLFRNQYKALQIIKITTTEDGAMTVKNRHTKDWICIVQEKKINDMKQLFH